MKQQSGCSSFGFMLFLASLSALGIVAFIFVSTLTARAEKSFGQADPGLSFFERTQLGIQLGWRAEALLRPVDPDAREQVFSIDLGEPTNAILNRLEEAGLLRDATLFGDYLVYSGLDRRIQAGEFEVSASMNAPALADALLDPTPGQVTLSVLAGWRIEELAASLPSSGLAITPEEFLAAANNPIAEFEFLEDLPSGASLEGYFLPGNYELDREADVNGLIAILLARFASDVGQDLLMGFQTQNLNIHEAVTLASIVQRESVVDEEMALIASVFLNRLAADIRLEADPTVQYALGYDSGSQSWWTNPLTSEHLKVESAYNTYLYGGLPPGPIASPSMEALSAVAFPEQSPYFFFQAACDGSGEHVFAVTYEEHISNNCP